MRKTIVTILTLTLATAFNAFAATPSKEENVGVGAGAVVGALAGGPVGFVIGAAIGAKVGDTMHRKSSAIESLRGSLQDSEGTVAELESDLRSLSSDVNALNGELERLQTIDRPQLIRLMQAGIAMDLLFRTDEHALADTTGNRLANLAQGLAAMSDVRIQLDGFADERGDSDYNLELSEKRVEFVRDQLVSAGIDPSRIRVAAHGESPAQDESADSYALERRVSLKLFIDGSPIDAQPLASNPN
ncbi:MAG: OmpA family protein [Gammaproteobacteria bacterium]|nr:OmpA family protein [Gammaproteobacteria bacterium]MDH3431544.1 OmpA family protein [Gammaproteobacteria bacterium]